MKTHACFTLSLAAAAALTVSHSAPARADAAGDAVLAKIDAAMNKAKTLMFDYEITNKAGPDKDERTMAMSVKLKGDKRYTEFSSPADMKGTKVLIISPTEMYVYLPSFSKVRRIASHTKDQGFLGLTFSQDDMATTRYGDAYTASVLSDDAATTKLSLTPKAGKETAYGKIEITITKDHMVISELKYFNAEGNNVKTETRTGYSCEGDVCTPGELKMTDIAKSAWTKLTAKSRKVNAEISDEVFTKRNLGE
jgi:outer membrane lipoprotein-sorting protein